MQRSKISTDSIEDGLIKQKDSKYKREVNKDKLTVDKGELRGQTDKYKRNNDKRKTNDEALGQQQSMEHMFVPNLKNKG